MVNQPHKTDINARRNCQYRDVCSRFTTDDPVDAVLQIQPPRNQRQTNNPNFLAYDFFSIFLPVTIFLLLVFFDLMLFDWLPSLQL